MIDKVKKSYMYDDNNDRTRTETSILLCNDDKGTKMLVRVPFVALEHPQGVREWLREQAMNGDIRAYRVYKKILEIL